MSFFLFKLIFVKLLVFKITQALVITNEGSLFFRFWLISLKKKSGLETEFKIDFEYRLKPIGTSAVINIKTLKTL